MTIDTRSNTGIGLFTYRQACTLMKIIAWACKHEDCGVTQDEAKELCDAIQHHLTLALRRYQNDRR